MPQQPVLVGFPQYLAMAWTTCIALSLSPTHQPTNPPTPRDDIWTSRLDVFVLVLAIEHLYDENLFLFVKIEFIYYDALLNVAFTMLDNQCSVA